MCLYGGESSVSKTGYNEILNSQGFGGNFVIKTTTCEDVAAACRCLTGSYDDVWFGSLVGRG